MAAVDQFEQMIGHLTEQAKQNAATLIARTREDLIAARSEEARLRLVEEFTLRIHEHIQAIKR